MTDNPPTFVPDADREADEIKGTVHVTADQKPVTHLSTTHHFDDETIDRLAAKDTPSAAQWRCAAATIIASQPHRRANVNKLIEDAGVLARWLEHGWRETP
jgi:hypothetical protein